VNNTWHVNLMLLWYNSAMVVSYGSLAQLVEHRPFKPRVMGSIPIGPTTSLKRQHH
jgi:hypothetical protein